MTTDIEQQSGKVFALTLHLAGDVGDGIER